MTAGNARIVSTSANPGSAERRVLRKELLAALRPDGPAVILDLSARNGLDHDDIDMLLDSASEVIGRDVRFVLVAGSTSNRVLLDVSRIASVLPVFNSLAEALHEFNGIAQPLTQSVPTTDSVRPQEHTYDSHRA